MRFEASVRDGDVVLLNGHDDTGPLLLDVDSEEYSGADTVLLAKRCIQGDVAQIAFGEDCARLLVVELDDGFARIEAVDKPGVGLDVYVVFAQIGTADNGCRGDIPVRIDACKVVAEELGGFRIINRSVHLTVQGIEYFVVFIANLR